MSRVPYADSTGYLSVNVELRYAADVFLVDDINFRRYQSGQNFNYFGGHYNQTPVTISVEGSGRWYLIVIGSDYRYRFY